MINGFKDLRVYQKAYELNLKIYSISMNFPEIERYILLDQIRRAAISIPLNIAEGYGKKDSDADFKRFLKMAVGSCNEIEVLLDMSYDLKYISEKAHEELIREYVTLRKQIYSMIKNWSSEK